MSLRGARLAQIQVALMLLTRLPAGQLQPPAPSLSAALWAFPLAGLAVGGLAALTMALGLWLHLSTNVAAGLAIAVGILATGALHEDGLADLADGFGGGRDRDQKLAIMRDSRIGSYGALALILSVGLRWQTIAALPGAEAVWALLVIAAASRAGLPLVIWRLPAARPDGLGKSAAGANWRGVWVAALVGAIALACGLGPAKAALVALAMALTGFCIARLALRQIGGQTGDVLGAMQQTTELAAWVMLLAIASA